MDILRTAIERYIVEYPDGEPGAPGIAELVAILEEADRRADRRERDESLAAAVPEFARTCLDARFELMPGGIAASTVPWGFQVESLAYRKLIKGGV